MSLMSLKVCYDFKRLEYLLFLIPYADTPIKVKLLLGDTGGLTRSNAKGARPMALDHKEVEDYLSRYSGLLIYLKEMDQSIYAKLCAVRSFIFTINLTFIKLFTIVILFCSQ